MAKDQTRDSFESDFEFDPNDFEGFDLGSFNDPEPVTNDRNPVLKVTGAAVSGASKALKDTELQRSIIEKSLPDGYVRTYDAAIAAKSIMDDLHYDAKQSLSELIKTTKNTIAPLSDKISNNLPKEMADKINSWAATGKDNNYQYDPNEYRRMEMQSVKNEIFGGWEQIRDEINADRTKAAASPDMATEVYNSSIQHELLSSIYEESSKIRLNSDIDKDFRDKVLVKLHEKQIELGFKTLWAVTSVADIAKQHFEFDRANTPKIVKNTGLPELVKEHNNEIAMKLLKQKSLGGAVELFGSSFSDIGGRIVRKTKDQINTFFKEAVGTTMRASTFIQSMGGDDPYDDVFDPNESEEDRNKRKRRKGMTDTASGIAEKGAGLLTNKYARKMGEKLRSYSENNPKIARMGMGLSNFFDAMPNHINDALGTDRESGSFIWDELKKTFGLDELKWKDKTLVRGQSLDDLSTRAVYTIHEKRAITEIIPGWLSRIHNEIRMHRTGMNDLEPMSWSFESNKFEDAGETATRIKKKFLNEERMKRSGADLDGVINAIDEGGTLNEGAREELRRVLAKAAYDPSQRISLETLAGNDNLSEDTQRALRDMSRELQGLNINLSTDDSVLGDIKKDFKGTKEEHERRARIYSSMRNLRSGLPSNFNDALKYTSAGEMEHLAKQGIVTQNDKGEWHYNRDKMSDTLLAHSNQSTTGQGFASGGLVSPKAKIGETSFHFRQDMPGDSPLYKKVKKYLRELSPEQLEATFKYLKLQEKGVRLQQHHRPWKAFHDAVPKDFANYIDANRDNWSSILYIVEGFKDAPDGINKIDLRGKLPKNNISGGGGPTKKSHKNTDLGGVTHANEFVVNAKSTGEDGAADFLNEFNSKGMKALDDSRSEVIKDLIGPGGIVRKFLPGIANNTLGHIDNAMATGRQVKSMLPRIKTLLGKKGGALSAASMSGELEKSMGPGDAANVMLATEQVSLTRKLLDRFPERKTSKTDVDGDGLRDGSWQEQLKNKGKGKGEIVAKAGEVAKDKPKSIFGMIGALVTMVGGLATTVGTWLSKIWSGGKAIFTAIKSFLQMKAAGNAMDSLGDMTAGRGRRRRRMNRMSRRGGGLQNAANTAGRFGVRGKLVAGGLMAASMIPMLGGGGDETIVDSATGLAVDTAEEAGGSNWMDHVGTAADVATMGGMAYGATKIGGRILGGATDAASTAAMSQGGRTAIGTAGRAIATRAGGMLAGQAARTGLVALAGMISAPVALGIGAVALAAYGGYKLYKYMKSKKAYANNWRMAQYGYGFKESDANEKIGQLEVKCLEFVKVSKDQPAQFTKGVKPEELVSIFNIDINDKAAVSRWASWFAYRFKPVFLNSVSVYFKLTGNTNMQEADDKLTDAQKKTFVESTMNSSPGSSSPYQIMASPLSDEETVRLDYSGVQTVYRDILDTLKKDTAAGREETEAEQKAKKEASAANGDGKSWWEKTKEKTGSWMTNLSSGLKDSLGKIKGGAIDLWNKTTTAAGNAWENTKETVSGAASAVGEFGAKIYDKLTGGTKANQLAVYKSFINAGFSKNQALALTAEVGRENGYQAKALWGGHIDAAKDKNGNRIANLGFISWNRERRDKLIARAKAAGVMVGPNQIAESQEGLNVMAKFVMEEMKGPYSKGLASFLNDPNIDPESAAPILGKKYIGWAYGQDKLRGGMTFDWRKHDAKRRGYLDQIKGQVGNAATPTSAPEKAGGGGQAFIPLSPAAMAEKNKKAITNNPMGAGVKVPTVAGMAAANSAGKGINSHTAGANEKSVVGPVNAGIVSGNVPKGHKAVKAATIATQKANATSSGWCAKFVANALQGAGYKFTRQNSAWQYANGSLASAGFKRIANSGKYQIGDVLVWPAHGQGSSGGAVHGHIQIFNGRNWVSDFIQANLRPGAKYSGVTPSLWRDGTLLNANIQGSVEAKGATPSGKSADDTKPEGGKTPVKAAAVGATAATVTAKPANNGGTTYSSADNTPKSSGSGSASYSGGDSTSTTVSNNLGNANVERIANEQLKTLNSMDSNLSKILQSLTRMEKNGGLAQQAAAQQQQAQANQGTNSQSNSSSTNNANPSGVGKGLESLFGKKTEAPKTAPIDLRS